MSDSSYVTITSKNVGSFTAGSAVYLRQCFNCGCGVAVDSVEGNVYCDEPCRINYQTFMGDGTESMPLMEELKAERRSLNDWEELAGQ